MVGVDLGATNVRAGAFTSEGDLLAVNQDDLQAHRGVQHGLERIASVVDRVMEEAGGKVIQPKSTIPGVGYFAYCADTEGNVFGIMEEDPDAK